MLVGVTASPCLLTLGLAVAEHGRWVGEGRLHGASSTRWEQKRTGNSRRQSDTLSLLVDDGLLTQQVQRTEEGDQEQVRSRDQSGKEGSCEEG